MKNKMMFHLISIKKCVFEAEMYEILEKNFGSQYTSCFIFLRQLFYNFYFASKQTNKQTTTKYTWINLFIYEKKIETFNKLLLLFLRQFYSVT